MYRKRFMPRDLSDLALLGGDMPAPDAPTAPVRALAPFQAAPVAATSGKDYEFPTAPTAPVLPAAPVRDVAGEFGQTRNAALIAALGGLLLGGGLQGGLAAASGVTGSLRQRNDAAFSGRMQRYSKDVGAAQAKYKTEHQQFTDQTSGVLHQMAADKQQQDRIDKQQDDAAKASDKAAEGERQRGDDAEKVYQHLETLTGPAQQEAIQRMFRDGTVDRLKLNFPQNENGLYLFNGKTVAQQNLDDAKITKVQEKTQERTDAADKQTRETLVSRLKNDYALLANPRLSKVGAGMIGKRIVAAETKLGLAPGGDGSEYAKLLDALTPEQRERARQANQTHKLGLARLEYQKSESKKRDAYRAQTMEIRMQTAKRAADGAVARASGNVRQVFNKNQSRLTEIERQLNSKWTGKDGKTHGVDDETRAALELEHDTISDQQYVLAPKVTELKPVTLQKVTGEAPVLAPSVPITVNGQTFKVRHKKKPGAK